VRPCCNSGLSSIQAETIRKEIQAFVLLRALYRRVHLFATSATAPLPDSSDDLCASITDKTFLCLEEKNLLPANCALGTRSFAPLHSWAHLCTYCLVL
jgi:hypothetical protein